MLRWILRILLTILLLIVLAAVAVQIVLWTNLPRNLVISKVQKELKLRVTCQKLSTNWSGHTSLSDVTVSLPLSTGSFLKLSELKVHHASLIALLFGRPMDVKELELDNPELVVQQDPAGRWNLQDVLELVRRAAGSNEANAKGAQQSSSEAYALPHIIVSNATVRVINRQGEKADIAPINLNGQAEGPLVYAYDLAVGKPVVSDKSAKNSPTAGASPESTQPVSKAAEEAAAMTGAPIYIKGKLVPGGVWQHEFGISIRHIGPWLTPFVEPGMAKKLADVAFEGRWRGGVYGQAVIGRLDIKKAFALGKSASGGINLTMQGGTMTAKPDDFVVKTDIPLLPSVQLTEGSVYSDGTIIRATGLIAQLTEGRINIDGSFDFRQHSADVTADWDQLNAPTGPLVGFVQSGHVKATYRQTWAGETVISGDVKTSGLRASDGWQWDATAKLSGQGNFATQFAWTLAAAKLHIAKGIARDQQNFNFDGLTASVTQAKSVIALQSLSVPRGMLSDDMARGTLAAHGKYDKGNDEWGLSVQGQEWQWHNQPVTFDLSANGDLTDARITQFSATYDKVRLSATGTISKRHHATELDITCAYPPFNLESYRGGLPLQGGEFASELHLTGDISPLELNVSGRFHGKELMFAGRRVGDFSVDLSKAHIDLSKAELEPTTINLFGGKWLVSGRYRFGSKTPAPPTLPADATAAISQPAIEQQSHMAVVAKLENMSLKEMDNFITPPPKMDGKFSGTWTVTMRNNDVNELDIRGPFHITNLQTKDFQAAHVDGQVRVVDGQVMISPIVVRRAEKAEEGVINARAGFAVRTPGQIKIDATPIAWPVVLAGDPQAFAVSPAILQLISQPPGSAPEKNFAPPASGPATAPENPPIEGKPPMVLRETESPIMLVDLQTQAAAPAKSATAPASTTPVTRPVTRPLGPPLVARVWGSVEMQLDLKPFQLSGPITGGRLLLTRGDKLLADLHAEGNISDTQLVVSKLSGRVIGGTVEGSATLFLSGERIFQSHAHIGFGGIDASRIVQMIPEAGGLAGVFGGQVDLTPTTDPRALGKLQLTAHINVAGGHWRTISIGDATLTAYFDREPPGPINPSAEVAARAAAANKPAGGTAQPLQPITPGAGSPLLTLRAVLDDSRFEIGGGTLHLWARYARPDDETFLNLQAQFSDLDLNQLIYAGQNSAATQAAAEGKTAGVKSYPGQLSGTVALFGDPQRPQDLFGQGSVKLDHTDLAGTNVIGALYSIMSFHFGHSNEGHGSADFRLDAGQLDITRFYYFNQGLEARGDAAIFNFWKSFADAEIKGQVVGSVRPLRDLKLPFAADADKILSVLQANVTTMAIEGKLRDPQVHPLAFSDIGDALRQILVGDTEHNPQ